MTGGNSGGLGSDEGYDEKSKEYERLESSVCTTSALELSESPLSTPPHVDHAE